MGTKSKDQVLENFMKEFFPFDDLQEIGFFTKEMKEDYQAQANRVCKFFGFKTIYEYGSKEVRCHLSFTQPLKDEPFITEIKNIYES